MGSDDDIVMMEVEPTNNTNNTNNTTENGILSEDHTNFEEEAKLQNNISNEEAEVYDRQIRVWGLEAQNR